jgi:RNA polymerase sigma factor (sigma-70 family)
MSETPPGEDDATLVRRIANRDEGALIKLMKRYAPKVTGYLISQFYQLKRQEIDQAVNDAAQNLWRSAGTFNIEKGKFGSWFLTIAHRAALDILEGEEKEPAGELDFDPRDVTSDDCDDEPESLPLDEWRVQQLDDIIENVLTGFEQILARADMAVGGSADSVRLAELHNKTIGTVHTTRSKVRKKIKRLILEREAVRNTTKGSK